MCVSKIKTTSPLNPPLLLFYHPSLGFTSLPLWSKLNGHLLLSFIELLIHHSIPLLVMPTIPPWQLPTWVTSIACHLISHVWRKKVMKIVIMWCTKLLVDIIPMASDSKNLSASCCILHRWQTQPFSRLLRLLCLFPFLNWEKIKTHQLYSSRLYNSRAFTLYPFLTTGSFSIFSHHPGLAPMSAKEMASCSRIQTLQIKEDSMASMKYVFWRR